jgi:hypothetical protein
MKLRTAIHAADKVLIEVSSNKRSIRFRVTKAEVNRLINNCLLDADLDSVLPSEGGFSLYWLHSDSEYRLVFLYRF